MQGGREEGEEGGRVDGIMITHTGPARFLKVMKYLHREFYRLKTLGPQVKHAVNPSLSLITS
jgi:hypothetical protein